MKKIKYWILFIILFVTILPLTTYGNNYLRIRYGIDNSELSYRNSYFAYGFHYSFKDQVSLNLNLKKLPDEDGYYPTGYFKSSNWGVYERGSYSLVINEMFHLEKVILGNYNPHFGQGLLFGGGYPLYVYNPYYDLSRFRDDIAVSRSYSKASILEGLVLKYKYDNINIRPFVSWNSYDCSAGESDYYKYNDNDFDGIPNNEDDDDFTGEKNNFPDTYSCKYSLEKAVNDELTYSSEEYRERRNKLTEYLLGLNSSIESENYKAGLTFIYSKFNRMIDPYYNFDPDRGDKTSYYFRGKGYIAGEAYLKYNGDIQVFTDIVGSHYRSISYYEKFSDKNINAFGFSSGIRTKVDNISLLFWAAYVPANLVNPHAVEYPWGRRNYASVVSSMGFTSDRAYLNQWMEVSKELFNIDDPGSGEEKEFSYNYNFIYEILDNLSFEIRQNYYAIDNYYYFPGSRSYKIVTKLNLKQRISKNVRLTNNIECRLGKGGSSSLLGGIGAGSRIVLNKNNNQFKGMIFGYFTSGSVLTSLYPYEPSVYRWVFFPSALNGKGVLISTSYIKDLKDSFTVGFKIRYNINFEKFKGGVFKFYIDTEMRF